eukprot:421191-Prorocentrum_minimum.AAC.1
MPVPLLFGRTCAASRCRAGAGSFQGCGDRAGGAAASPGPAHEHPKAEGHVLGEAGEKRGGAERCSGGQSPRRAHRPGAAGAKQEHVGHAEQQL